MSIACSRRAESLDRRNLAALTLSVVLLTGCSSSKPDRGSAVGSAAVPIAAAPRADDARFISGFGTSTEGFAQAEMQAKAEVASQVRSQLSSVLTSVMSSTTQGTVTKDYQRLLSETSSQTSFSHAELIRVDPTSRRVDNGLFRATARLSREEASAALSVEYDAAAVDFRVAVDALLADSMPLMDWTATLRRAESGFRKLSEAHYALRAVARRDHGSHAEDIARFDAIERLRAAKLTSTRLSVNVRDSKSYPELVASIHAALARMGLSGAAPCGSEAYELQLTPEVRWESGPFGPLCRLGVQGDLRRCGASERLAVVSIENRELLGTDTRERDRALHSLWSRTTPERLLPSLRDGLISTLPVERGQW